jgi:hypothetical protein
MNEKELRMVEYALHTLLSNWDNEIDGDNMEEDGITLKDLNEYTRYIENLLEEKACSK